MSNITKAITKKCVVMPTYLCSEALRRFLVALFNMSEIINNSIAGKMPTDILGS